jgi:predicted phosphodiesterase
MFDITVLGSVSGGTPFAPARIADVLAMERTPLRYGSDFVGRPVTAVYRDDTALAKLRTEFDWAHPVMEKWGLKTLARERELGVHHPDKTWFLAFRREDERLLVGNICPVLQPLNQMLAGPPADAAERRLRLSWFESLFRMYFDLGRKTGAKLDEGLSNFGLDATGLLYYLDDDIYTWDNLIALPHVLGTWFRTHEWFDPDFAADLGSALRQVLHEDPEGAHHAQVIAEQVRGLYMPQPGKQEALAAFGAALVRREARPANRQQPGIPSRAEQRYLALLGDIHANLPALDAVLGFLREQGIGRGLVLGDLVGYGPHPCECIERIAESDFTAIKGNHDHAAVTGNMTKGFSQMAKWCLDWTIPLLDETHRDWLAQLPLSFEGEGWIAVHGAPVDPGCFNGYVYVMTYEDNLDNLEQRGIPLCFHGHTHVPAVYARLSNRRSDCYTDSQQSLAAYRQALVCPGSVGQPRNRQAGAQVGIWDRAEGKLSFITLPYDVEATVQAMRDAGFPDSLGQRLLSGI